MENKYKTIKLDKGMYEDKTKSFSEILEELDPSENYESSSLSNLDAFQRQLKRFNIKVQGKNSDTVEKFFSTKDAQALFPEYISRSISAGIEEENDLKSLIANTIKIDNLNYRNICIDSMEKDQKVQPIGEGEQIPEIKLNLKENSVKLKKIGSMLTCSYETIQYQKISAFNIALKQIGKNFNTLLFKDAVSTILEGDGNENKCNKINMKQKLSYPVLVDLWAKLKPYNLTTLVVSPMAMQKILLIPEFLNPQTGLNFQGTGSLNNPLGAKIIYSNVLEGNTVLALDKNYCLNHIISQYLSIESDKIIDKQLNKSVITMRYAFTKLFKDACLAIVCEN